MISPKEHQYNVIKSQEEIFSFWNVFKLFISLLFETLHQFTQQLFPVGPCEVGKFYFFDLFWNILFWVILYVCIQVCVHAYTCTCTCTHTRTLSLSFSLSGMSPEWQTRMLTLTLILALHLNLRHWKSTLPLLMGPSLSL